MGGGRGVRTPASTGPGPKSRTRRVVKPEKGEEDESSADERPTPTSRANRTVTFQTPATPASSRKKKRRDRDDEDVEEDQEEETATPGTSSQNRSQSQSQSQKTSKRGRNKSQSQRSQLEETDVDMTVAFDFMEGRELTMDEMRRNVVFYMILRQAKMHPVKKSDLIKVGMNRQSRDFREVIDHAGDVLMRDFGMKLVGMKNGPGDINVECMVMEATSYILVSKFRQNGKSQVIPFGGLDAESRKGGHRIVGKALLMVVLSSTYMMDKPIDEDTVWTMVEQLQLDELLGVKRETLRRFLKSEFVDTLYLSKFEEKTADHQLNVRYGWGFRADLEFSKYSLLKFVAKKLGKRTFQFPKHLAKISRKEIELIDTENENENENENAAATENTSDGHGGKGGGSQSESSTEGEEEETQNGNATSRVNGIADSSESD